MRELPLPALAVPQTLKPAGSAGWGMRQVGAEMGIRRAGSMASGECIQEQLRSGRNLVPGVRTPSSEGGGTASPQDTKTPGRPQTREERHKRAFSFPDTPENLCPYNLKVELHNGPDAAYEEVLRSHEVLCVRQTVISHHMWISKIFIIYAKRLLEINFDDYLQSEH